MTGTIMISAGVLLILLAAVTFPVCWRILEYRKRRIREEGYQIYE